MDLNISTRIATVKALSVIKRSPGQDHEEGVATLTVETMMALSDVIPLIGGEQAGELQGVFWDEAGDVAVAEDVGIAVNREFLDLDLSIFGEVTTCKCLKFEIEPTPQRKMLCKFRIVVPGASGDFVARAYNLIGHGVEIAVHAPQFGLDFPEESCAEEARQLAR